MGDPKPKTYCPEVQGKCIQEKCALWIHTFYHPDGNRTFQRWCLVDLLRKTLLEAVLGRDLEPFEENE